MSDQLLKELKQILSEPSVDYEHVAKLLEKIRASCSNKLHGDIASNQSGQVEDRLWESHQHVNSHFRAALHKLSSGQNKAPVEKRKLENAYLRFLATSQTFYRSYISGLSKNYGGVPGLDEIAKTLNRDGATSKRREVKNPQIRAAVTKSCYRSLIQLGDLSRYRETEFHGREKNWSHATRFYDLANMVEPSSGLGHNGLAVVALADNNLIDATYHLYRTLSTAEPFPQADMNLKRAFFKITTAWDNKELGNDGRIIPGSSCDGLIPKHLRFISKCHHGKSFSKHNVQEEEVIQLLTASLKSDIPYENIRKLILINIAAGAYAQKRFQNQNNDEHIQSILYFLRFNIRFFVPLLEAVRYEVASTLGHGDSLKAANIEPAVLSNNCQKLLPMLRIFSSWLAVNLNVMTNSVDGLVDEEQTKLWANYAACLTDLSLCFSVESLEDVSFMLDEDIDTRGFEPLICEETRQVWFDGTEKRPVQLERASIEKFSPTCNLTRIRGILQTGFTMAQTEEAPITYNVKTRTFACTRPHDPLPQIALPEPTSIQATSIDNKGPRLDEAQEDEEDAKKMVSSIVDENDEDTIFETPAQARHNSGKSRHSSNSSYPIGTNTANELLAAAQNHFAGRPGSSSSSAVSPSMANMSLRPGASRSGSFNSPVLGPPLIHNRSPFVPSAQPFGRLHWEGGNQAPILPQLGVNNSGATLSPMNSRSSLARHNRMNSSDSTHSQQSIWSPNVGGGPDSTWGGTTTTSAANQSPVAHLGNGTFGMMDPTERNLSMDPGDSPFMGSTAQNPWRTSVSSNDGRAATAAQTMLTGSPRIGATGSRGGGTPLWQSTTSASGVGRFRNTSRGSNG